MKIYYKNETDK